MSEIQFYKLVDGVVVPAKDVLDWTTWFQGANRIVAHDEGPEGAIVSTVFVGVPMFLWDPNRPRPLLFETRVSGGEGYIDRYASWNEAVAGHAAILARVLSGERSETEIPIFSKDGGDFKAMNRDQAWIDFKQSEPDPDHSMFHCPCGSTFTWTGIDPELLAWRAEHRSHLMRDKKAKP